MQTHCGWMFFPCLLILLLREGQDTSRKARGAVLCSVRAHSEAWFPLEGAEHVYFLYLSATDVFSVRAGRPKLAPQLAELRGEW